MPSLNDYTTGRRTIAAVLADAVQRRGCRLETHGTAAYITGYTTIARLASLSSSDNWKLSVCSNMHYVDVPALRISHRSYVHQAVQHYLIRNATVERSYNANQYTTVNPAWRGRAQEYDTRAHH